VPLSAPHLLHARTVRPGPLHLPWRLNGYIPWRPHGLTPAAVLVTPGCRCENVLLASDPNDPENPVGKVADFGLSRAVEVNKTHLTTQVGAPGSRARGPVCGGVPAAGCIPQEEGVLRGRLACPASARVHCFTHAPPGGVASPRSCTRPRPHRTQGLWAHSLKRCVNCSCGTVALAHADRGHHHPHGARAAGQREAERAVRRLLVRHDQ